MNNHAMFLFAVSGNTLSTLWSTALLVQNVNSSRLQMFHFWFEVCAQISISA